MSTRLRRGTGALVAVALLAAGCAENDQDPSAGDDAPTETAPTSSATPPETRGGPADDAEDASPTEPAPPPFAGLDDSSTAPAVELCEALATRQGSAVVDLMADDVIATDHATGEIYRGREEIRAWIDDDLGFELFERTDCGPSDTAIASHFWSAVTFARYSDTTPGGTEGIAVVGVIDGRIDRFDALYSLSSDETDVAEPLPEADQATLIAWCGAWGALDLEQVRALTTDDVRVVPNIMAVDEFFRPRPGPTGIRGAMDFAKGANLDRADGDCAEAHLIANGGWFASTSALVDDESGTTLGGVSAWQLRDGLISAWTNFADFMMDDTLVPDATLPQVPEAPVDPALLEVVTALETVAWWDFAADFLGADLAAPEARNDVAADVVGICTFLASGPGRFDDVLDELNRVGERRVAELGTGDARAYTLVLDTAISSACPTEAARLDDLRPPTDPPPVPLDLVARGVDDPRPGDLRSDPTADVLPFDYQPPPAFLKVQLAYGTDPAQQLDLYLPPNTASPVVVFLHSGGWTSGDKSNVPEMVLRFIERGYAVASVGYRLAPPHTFPAPINDAKEAIRYLKAFGAREGLIDGDRIVLFGASAGGHIAALVAATPGLFEPTNLTTEEATFDSSVAGLVSVVGPTDLVSFDQPGTDDWGRYLARSMLGCDPCSDAQLEQASPTSYLSPDLPPAYWAYGSTDERLVHWYTQGAVIASAWAEQVGPGSSRFDLIDGAGHNIFHWSINQRALEEFVDFAVGRR